MSKSNNFKIKVFYSDNLKIKNKKYCLTCTIYTLCFRNTEINFKMLKTFKGYLF